MIVAAKVKVRGACVYVDVLSSMTSCNVSMESLEDPQKPLHKKSEHSLNLCCKPV